MNAFISFFSSLMGTVVVSVVNIFIWLVLIVVFTFFFLYYRQLLRQFLLKLLKEENSLRFEKSINAVKKLVKHFMTGVLIEMLAVALLSGILLSIFGIQHSIMLALLAAVLNIIPYAGIYSATLLGVLISYGNTNSTAAVTTAIIFLFVHLVDANLLMPRIMESQVKLNSFAALVAVLSGGLIWGVPGMFLAIPLTAVARILFEQIPSCQPLALLLGNDIKNSSLIPPKKSEI